MLYAAGKAARRLVGRVERLRLIVHRTPLSSDLASAPGVEVARCDLARCAATPRSLTGADLVSLHPNRGVLDAAAAALIKENIEGIYHLGDERPFTIQEFLDEATRMWGYPRPWENALVDDSLSGRCVRGVRYRLRHGLTSHTRLRPDRARSHCGDTRRMREALLPRLKYPTVRGRHGYASIADSGGDGAT